MLYPLSYEGLTCTFALDTGRVSVRWARACYRAPDGLCRTCAACRVSSSGHCTRHAAPIVRLPVPGHPAGMRVVKRSRARFPGRS